MLNQLGRKNDFTLIEGGLRVKEFRILFQKLGRMILMALSNLELALESYIVVELWRLGLGR